MEKMEKQRRCVTIIKVSYSVKKYDKRRIDPWEKSLYGNLDTIRKGSLIEGYAAQAYILIRRRLEKASGNYWLYLVLNLILVRPRL